MVFRGAPGGHDKMVNHARNFWEGFHAETRRRGEKTEAVFS